MNISQLDYASLTGHSFSLAERTALSAATTLLLAQTKHKQVTVLGKVYGHRADYIVVTCSSEDPLAADSSTFFSTDSGVTFNLLPPPSAETPPLANAASADSNKVVAGSSASTANLCKAISGVYMGEPAFEYRPTDPVSGLTFAVKETERLSCFAAAYQYSCCVAPRGAYSRRLGTFAPSAAAAGSVAGKTPASSAAIPTTVKKNATFDGLDRTAAGTLASYVHLRTEALVRSQLEKENVAVAVDCFDAVSADVPQGTWCLKYDAVLDVVYAQSLLYSGAVFYHQPESAKIFGNAYFGDGAVNKDLAFML
jgi:hypothetical protein